MIYIHKEEEPPMVRAWKAKRGHVTYKDMPMPLRRELRNALLHEQGYVCCFCGTALGRKENTCIVQMPLARGEHHNVRNAHIAPQSRAPDRVLDYDNICASCDGSFNRMRYPDVRKEAHCDIRQGDALLPVTPLQEDCLSYFSFSTDGSVHPNPAKSLEDQEKARQTIAILGLNAGILRCMRAGLLRLIEEVVHKIQEKGWPDGDGEAGVAALLDNLARRDRDGRFAPFYFVALSYFGRAQGTGKDSPGPSA